MLNNFRIHRRALLCAPAAYAFNGGCAMSFPAIENKPTGTKLDLQYEKTLKINESVWGYALSPDGAYIAILTYPSARVLVKNIESDQDIEIYCPDIKVKSNISWGSDSESLLISSDSIFFVTSIRDKGARGTIFNMNGYRSAPACTLSDDRNYIIFQNLNQESKDVVLKLDLKRQNIVDRLSLSNMNEFSSVMPGNIQFHGSELIFNTFYKDLSTIERDVKKVIAQKGRLIPATYATSISLLDGSKPNISVEIQIDVVNGFDLSGILRQFPSKCLRSGSNGYLVIFRESGTIIHNYNVNFSKDKAFEVYSPRGERVSAFGGYGAIEGNHINDFDLHPVEPWAVTTAARLADTQLARAGALTVWDINTGLPLQRLLTPEGIRDPRIALDGSFLTALDRRGISIYRFK